MLNKKGFSLVEAVVAIAIAVMFFLSVYEIILFSSKITSTGMRKVEATYLAQEGIEAVRVIRNNSWADGIAILTDGANYYLVLSGNQWTLTATPQALINGIFARTVVLSAVNGDANDDISASGTPDTKTKKVTVNVAWTERGTNYSTNIQTYLTDFLSN